MDPDAALEEILETAHAVLEEPEEVPDAQDALVHIASLIADLDEWMTDGFLPRRWERARSRERLSVTYSGSTWA